MSDYYLVWLYCMFVRDCLALL